MEVPEEHLETLVDLGLTSCQAKVYLATIQSGKTKAKEVAEVTKIARPYVYKIITELEMLGFIEKTIGKHSEMKAIPLKVGISHLVQRKKQEMRSVTRKAEKLLREFKKYNSRNKVQDYPSQFIWLSEKEPYIRKRREEIDNAQKSIDFVTSWRRFPLTVYTFSENVERAVKRKVKMRVIIEKPPKDHSLPKVIEKLKEYQNYYIKYIPYSPKAVMGIFDKKKIIFDASSSAGLAECPALWSNNPCLVDSMHDYYETLWTTSLKET